MQSINPLRTGREKMTEDHFKGKGNATLTAMLNRL